MISRKGETHEQYAMRILSIPSLLKFNLKFIVQELGIPETYPFHEAGGDVFYTREVYLRLKSYYGL
jgi:hypothetical protein